MEGQDVSAGFPKVDQSDEKDFFVQFLDIANKIESVLTLKQRMLALLEIKEGQSLLDTGCGTGEDVREMAARVGSTGRVTGIDYSQTMVDVANRRIAGTGLPAEVQQGDTHNLQFADNSFDGCRSERSFMHLADPAKALSEMVRVAKPGGRVVIFDFDWEAVVVDHPDRQITRKLINFMSDSIRQSWIGRQLPNLFREAGLINIKVVPHTVMPPYSFFQQIYGGALKQAQESGLVSAEELENWWAKLAETQQSGAYFTALQGFIVSGQKPQ